MQLKVRRNEGREGMGNGGNFKRESREKRGGEVRELRVNKMWGSKGKNQN